MTTEHYTKMVAVDYFMTKVKCENYNRNYRRRNRLAPCKIKDVMDEISIKEVVIEKKE